MDITKMPNRLFNLSAAQISAYPWQDVITLCPKPVVSSYYESLQRVAAECQDKGDSVGVEAHRFLAGIFSFRMKLDGPRCEYHPLFEGAPAPHHYHEEDLDVLDGILPSVVDPDSRARIADFLWVHRKKKNPDHARTAIEALFLAADLLESETADRFFTERVQRAFQLSAMLGTDKELFKNTVERIDKLVTKYSTMGKSWICADLLDTLLVHPEANAVKHADLCGSIASRLQNEGDFTFSRSYWNLRSICLRRSGDSSGARQAKLSEAEVIILEAEAATKRPIPSYGAGKEILAKGIEAFRQLGEVSRVDELRKRHAHYAKESLKELTRIEIPSPDLSEGIIRATNEVKGKELPQALLMMAHIPATNVGMLEKSITESGSVFQLLFATNYLNEDGKTVARSPGLKPSSKDLQDAHLKAKMFESARSVHWPIRVQAAILPMLRQINYERNISLTDTAFLVVYNPFVAPGREDVIARAILAGIHGDWFAVAHLVPPQIEHMLRYILAQSGVITSSLDDEGIEEEYSLGKILMNIPEMESILGQDLLFDLRGILIENPGANLRNRMAHGLMAYPAFFDDSIIYLWWLLLKLCYLPTLKRLAQNVENAPEKTSEG